MSLDNRQLVRDFLEAPDLNMTKLANLFYQELSDNSPSLRSILSLDRAARERKFFNMLAVIKNAKHLERIQTSIQNIGKQHLRDYGAKIEDIPLIKNALMNALSRYLGEQSTPALKLAWYVVFDEISELFIQALKNADRRYHDRNISPDIKAIDNVLERMGGYDTILRIHTRFYERIFDDPWIGQFFRGKHESTLARKQTEFMVASFGGENLYKGDTPAQVHMHMYITHEQLEARETILRWAIAEEGLNDELIEYWLQIDRGFWGGIEKDSVDDCVMKCMGQNPIIARKPG